MLKLALITRAVRSQQGLSLWGSRGLSLISPRLLITGGSPGHKGISVHFTDKDLIFLGHFSCHWIIAIDWPVQKKIFLPPKCSQVGCGTLELEIPILTQAVCSRCLCTQTKPIKPNWTRTSPVRSHTPNETKGKDSPRNQKQSGKSAHKRW